jgi:putative membrane protein
MTQHRNQNSELPGQALRHTAGIAGRGVLMGLAEVVPGVSGGTMAFITGIYPDLVSSLARFGLSSVPMLAQPGKFYAHHNLRFLLSLGLGMVLGVLLFAQLMHFLLVAFQPLVWAFFSGVIAASVIVIGRVRAPKALWGWAPVGLLLGILLLWLPVAAGEHGLLGLFFGSAIAVCAWLLPAISGSFVLLTLGMYDQVISAIAELNWPVLFTVLAGCVSGVLLFVRLLSWLLHHFREALLSFLTGFMLGSLPKLWPWQDAEQAPGLSQLISPQSYAALFDAPAQTLFAVFLFAVGALMLWYLGKLGER